MFKYYINAEDKNVGARVFVPGPNNVLCTLIDGAPKAATSEQVYNAFMSGTMAVVLPVTTEEDDGSSYVTRAITIKTTISDDPFFVPTVTEVNIDGTVLTINPDADVVHDPGLPHQGPGGNLAT